MQLDYIDKKLLDIIQNQFPLSVEPYQDIASLLDTSEENVITRLKKLKDEKIIRRMGAIFDSRKIGYCSTLCAMIVPSNRVNEVAQIVNDYPGVTHNYLRDDEYNMWFTITARTQSAIDKITSEIQEKSDIRSLINLPAVHTFKIEVKFPMLDEKTENLDYGKLLNPPNPLFQRGNSVLSFQGGNSVLSFQRRDNSITEYEQKIIKEIQEDINLCHSPFKSIADNLGIDEVELLSKVRELEEQGIIRRFGAVLRQRNVGMESNAMGVWHVPDEKIKESGAIMATFSQVSHCYQRVTSPEWIYNLYTMIHGKTAEDCDQVAKNISNNTGITDYRLLYSTRELKKKSMRYFTEEIED
jgi:DNA-binding Lrp family transcriptional regulator